MAMAAMACNAAVESKQALLMVHFGSTFDDTRLKTIDALNAEASAAFPDMDIFEAFTSRIVIKRLRGRGIEKMNPREALLKLAADGYESVFIQSSNIIDGIEAQALVEEARMMAPFFKDIRVGRPLLYSVEDCLEVTRIVSTRHADRAVKGKAVVFVGHGTSSPANAVYPQIDYMLKASGNPRMNVATVEGYPTFENAVDELRAEKAKDVTLIPFMFVAGDHARNDIDGEWKEKLTAEGFRAEAIIEGLGEIPEIRAMFIRHIREGLNERPLTPYEAKAAFLRNND